MATVAVALIGALICFGVIYLGLEVFKIKKELVDAQDKIEYARRVIGSFQETSSVNPNLISGLQREISNLQDNISILKGKLSEEDPLNYYRQQPDNAPFLQELRRRMRGGTEDSEYVQKIKRIMRGEPKKFEDMTDEEKIADLQRRLGIGR